MSIQRSSARISSSVGVMSSANLDSIVLLGDSLTQGGWDAGGFVQKLACQWSLIRLKDVDWRWYLDVYARKLDVINRGLSGYNSTWAIPVFEQLLTPTNAQEGSPKVWLLNTQISSRLTFRARKRLHY